MHDRTFTDDTGGRMLVSNDDKLGEVVIGMPSPESAIALDARSLAELIADLSARLARIVATSQIDQQDGGGAERARIVAALRKLHEDGKSLRVYFDLVASEIEAGRL